jgi:hypothetical protein
LQFLKAKMTPQNPNFYYGANYGIGIAMSGAFFVMSLVAENVSKVSSNTICI